MSLLVLSVSCLSFSFQSPLAVFAAASLPLHLVRSGLMAVPTLLHCAVLHCACYCIDELCLFSSCTVAFDEVEAEFLRFLESHAEVQGWVGLGVGVGVGWSCLCGCERSSVATGTVPTVTHPTIHSHTPCPRLHFPRVWWTCPRTGTSPVQWSVRL
jgi:hypothetical protein